MRVIGGKLRGLTLLAPKGRDTRPTSDRLREDLFNILQGRIADARVADLFAGTGAVAIEAVSRGAKKAVLVESSVKAMELIRKNIARTGCSDQFFAYLADVRNFLLKSDEAYDIMFFDPPYHFGDLTSLIKIVSDRGLLTETGVLIAETSVETVFPQIIGNLVNYRIKNVSASRLFFYRTGLQMNSEPQK